MSKGDELKELNRVIEEANLALRDKNRTVKDSNISQQITKAAAASGVMAGGAALMSGGLATGELAVVGTAGMLTPLAPVVFTILTVGLVRKIFKNKKKEEERKAKELAYKEAIAKQNAIIKALQEEKNADKERIELLVGINQLLRERILELEKELKKS